MKYNFFFFVLNRVVKKGRPISEPIVEITCKTIYTYIVNYNNILHENIVIPLNKPIRIGLPTTRTAGAPRTMYNIYVVIIQNGAKTTTAVVYDI